MKYGKIYHYFNKEEARHLIGKEVLVADLASVIDKSPDKCGVMTLKEIRDGYALPFTSGVAVYEYIREIIEEEPKYRPYKDCDEMITDYMDRFDIKYDKDKPWFRLPSIWIKRNGVEDGKYLITDYLISEIGTSCWYAKFTDLFGDYTYLDGSPIGKLRKKNDI